MTGYEDPVKEPMKVTESDGLESIATEENTRRLTVEEVEEREDRQPVSFNEGSEAYVAAVNAQASGLEAQAIGDHSTRFRILCPKCEDPIFLQVPNIMLGYNRHTEKQWMRKHFTWWVYRLTRTLDGLLATIILGSGIGFGMGYPIVGFTGLVAVGIYITFWWIGGCKCRDCMAEERNKRR
jgi:hypothetical protein